MVISMRALFFKLQFKLLTEYVLYHSTSGDFILQEIFGNVCSHCELTQLMGSATGI